jgi:hypothetical protein
MWRPSVSLSLLATCAACGTASTAPVPVQPLDPTQPHYGKTNAEWAAAWVQWVYQLPETKDCPDPVADPTGALCNFGQDPTSPVFFLTGDWGGVTKRTKATAPASKAILVPIVVFFQDNGGVSAAILKSDAQLKDSSVAQFQSIAEVHFSLDGRTLAPLDAYAVKAAPYQYTLPPEPNSYTCQGTAGVTGSYQGYTSGYFVLLPPLARGPHTIALSSKVNMPAFTLDVSYDPLTVE